MYVPVRPKLVLRTEGMRIRKIGEWQHVSLSWARSSIEKERNENESNRRTTGCTYVPVGPTTRIENEKKEISR
jgi:hypothetical protein